jgi:nicotinamide riboside kinase
MRSNPEHPLIICVTGAECTGKTTLAETLAATLQVPLVPEIARVYLAGKTRYTQDDVLAIAREQQAAELAALAQGPLVVADTDLTVIQVWWEEKYGELNPWLAAALAQRSQRRYLLPRPDLPWVFDPLRESPRDRPRLHRRYQQLLERGPFPFAEVEGVGEVRSLRAIAQVEDWLS